MTAWLFIPSKDGYVPEKLVESRQSVYSPNGTFMLFPYGVPREKRDYDWCYCFTEIPKEILVWAAVLQLDTIPINHHDPHRSKT